MIQKLSKRDDELVLVLDRALLDQLKIDESTPLELTTDGRALTVSPVDDSEYRQRFEQAMASVHERYAQTLRRLAE